MPLPQLTQDQLMKFRLINEQFGSLIQLHPPETWKSKNAKQIWLRVVSQVVVVGRAAPAERLCEVMDILDFDRLSSIPIDQAKKFIGQALVNIGTRMVSKKFPLKSPKVIALTKNLIFLKNYPGGPEGFIRNVAKLQTSLERVGYVKKHLSYIKDKGARDFLTTGFGLVANCIALDIRVMSVVSEIVPGFPKKLPLGCYEKIERYLIENICTPLDIEPAHLDQILFKFQKEIINNLKADCYCRD